MTENEMPRNLIATGDNSGAFIHAPSRLGLGTPQCLPNASHWDYRTTQSLVTCPRCRAN